MDRKPYLREGFSVSYVGLPCEGVDRGDRGVLVAFVNERTAHVQWKTGAREGALDVVSLDDLDNGAPAYAVHPLDDELADSLFVNLDGVGESRSDLDHSMIFEFPVSSVEGDPVTMLSALHGDTLQALAEQAFADMISAISVDSELMSQLGAFDTAQRQHVIQSLAAQALEKEALRYGE